MSKQCFQEKHYISKKYMYHRLPDDVSVRADEVVVDDEETLLEMIVSFQAILNVQILEE